MTPAPHPAFAEILRSRRDELNAKFVVARRQQPAIDADRVQHFLLTAVNALAASVQASAPERLDDVVVAAYDVALALVGDGMGAEAGRMEGMEAGWTELLPRAAAFVAEAPRRVLVAISNALHHLSVGEGARPEAWIAELGALTGSCANAEAWLAAGQICAWRAGLAHYREAALALADRLPPALALAAVGAAPAPDARALVTADESASAWRAVRHRLLVDPWFVPGDKGELPSFCAVGAFDGFGGVFRTPPIVTFAGRHLLARSGNGAWLLAADAFGATFHRAKEQPQSNDVALELPRGMTVAGQRLSIGAESMLVPLCGAITSVASDATTVAITSAFTHAIVLVPAGRAP